MKMIGNVNVKLGILLLKKLVLEKNVLQINLKIQELTKKGKKKEENPIQKIYNFKEHQIVLVIIIMEVDGLVVIIIVVIIIILVVPMMVGIIVDKNQNYHL